MPAKMVYCGDLGPHTSPRGAWLPEGQHREGVRLPELEAGFLFAAWVYLDPPTTLYCNPNYLFMRNIGAL